VTLAETAAEQDKKQVQPCSDEWEFGIVTRLGSHGATCSDLRAIHQRKYKNGKKEVSLVA
jgi:hypothetical protein